MISPAFYIESGGAPLPPKVKHQFEALTGCVVVEGYGLTEAAPVVCVNPLKGQLMDGTIGLPLPGTVVEIIDREDGKTPVANGERGELCARGPQVMVGYWGREDVRLTKDGRLHTGDVAILEDNGYVRIVDRIKDMIITNGYNVYPRNADAIYEHPSVEECIVAGLPDAQRGEMLRLGLNARTGGS